MRQLHPRAVWFLFLNYVIWWIVLGVLFGVMGALSLFNEPSSELQELFLLFQLWWWAFLLFVVVVSYTWARLSYHFYRYELREDGFRKELGVIYKKYVTIPYERIQNVDIYRGIFARLLGLSDLNIQTAGMSDIGRGGAGAFAEGRLPGLSRAEAEQIRDELIRRARVSREGGV